MPYGVRLGSGRPGAMIGLIHDIFYFSDIWVVNLVRKACMQ